MTNTVARQRRDVGVVIVNWNSGTDLRALLLDLRRQTGVNLEILVVDNASSDGSLVLAEKTPVGHTSVRSERNLGYCDGNNVGLQMLAHHEFVLLLNPDVSIRQADTVAVLRDALAGDRSLAAVAPTIRLGDGFVEYLSSVVDPDRAVVVHADTHVGDWPPGAPEMKRLSWIDGAAMLIRSECVRTIGGFDERFFLFQEDVEWCLRANERGWRTALARCAEVEHRRSSSFGSSRKGVYYYWRNLYLLCSLYAESRFRWRYRWIRSLLLSCARSHSIHYWRRGFHGAYDAVRGRYGPAPEDKGERCPP
jgi:GT2 family glycosyltransferase